MMHRAHLPPSNPGLPTPDGRLSHNAVRSQMPTEEVTNTLQVSVPLGVVVGSGEQRQVSKLLARCPPEAHYTDQIPDGCGAPAGMQPHTYTHMVQGEVMHNTDIYNSLQLRAHINVTHKV
ncbi:hypothetical protein NQZ68_001823 [Dissostichus eleginoides]|nr:hypothetical protein NQZ68_001823 [Dissostichus eleginoides]